jgi:cytochrome c553
LSRAVALLLLLCARGACAGAEVPAGEQIYKKQCARCHGPAGEGSKHTKRRLEGDQSVAQLADVIRRTMPESAPMTLTEEEARAVAAYAHGRFYSRVARERNRPARIALTRLTVRQYRQALADLVGSFRWKRQEDDQRGLKAEYFKGRQFRNPDRVVARIDPQVAFDFGTDAPIPEKMPGREFSLRWRGSLLARQTGEHELVVRTEHAARLWVNDERRPLIDAWVKSGKDTEYRASLFLVAGRAYPLRLEYTKGKTGVDDSKTNKRKPPPTKSSITLLWKAPGRPLEPVPGRCLSPNAAPEVYACPTPFPPDDRSYGWERGNAVSKEWDQAATDAALSAAAYTAARLGELAGVRDDAPDRKAKVRAFCHTFAARAFRRPLSEAQKRAVDRQLAAGKDLETGVKRVVLLVLKSPAFLYREVRGGSDGFDTAARLAFGLWDSLPDQALLAAAAAGKLATRDQVAAQAGRMLRDPRARAKLRQFLLVWLKADGAKDLSRDAKKFPGFDAGLVADLQTSLELFLDDVLTSEASDFRQLLLCDEVYLNGRLAKFYGADAPPGNRFARVKLDGGKRAGVLSHPYLMARFAHGDASSPIHRGVFLARGVLGVSLRPPPEAVAPLAPDLHPTLTTRQRVAVQTRPATCMTCHGIINPLGFTLENFDAVGRYRDRDNHKPVDPSGSYRTRDGKTVRAAGARELARFLASSGEVHAAFVEQLFHHLAQQPVRAYGPAALEDLTRSFAEGGFHVRNLAARVMTTAAMKGRDPPPAAGPR